MINNKENMYIKEEDNSEELARIREIIIEATKFIRLEQSYDKAATLLMQNNISLLQVTEFTLRLSMFDLAKLSDQMIALK